MKPLVHLWICILAAPVILAAAYYLDLWIVAAHSEQNPWEIGRALWIESLSRLLLAFLLFALSWLVLYRVPSRLVATAYVLVGAFLAFAAPLALSNLDTFGRSLLSIPIPRGFILHPFAPPALVALGLAAFVRRHLAPKPQNAGPER